MDLKFMQVVSEDSYSKNIKDSKNILFSIKFFFFFCKGRNIIEQYRPVLPAGRFVWSEMVNTCLVGSFPGFDWKKKLYRKLNPASLYVIAGSNESQKFNYRRPQYVKFDARILNDATLVWGEKRTMLTSGGWDNTLKFFFFSFFFFFF